MGGFQIGIGANAGAAASALDAVRNLRTTAAQQAKLDADAAQKEFNAELEIRKAGGVPYQETVAPADPNQPKGLARRTGPPGVDQSQVVTTPGGRKFVLPSQKAITPDQQATINHQGTDDLLNSLKAGARPVQSNGSVQVNGDIPVMRDDGQGNLSNTGRSGVWLQADTQPGTTFNAGNQKVYMATEAEKSEQELRQRTTEASAKQDAEGWILPDSLAAAAEKHAGLPPGSLRGVKLPHETVADAFKSATTPEKENAESPIPGYAGPKGGPMVRDTKTGKVTELELPPGSKPALTEEQQERAGEVRDRRADLADLRAKRQDDTEQAAIEKLQSRADVLQRQEDDYRQLADTYNGAIGVANGQAYAEPTPGKGSVNRMMTTGRRTAMGEAYMRYKGKADDIAKQRAALSKEIDSRQAKRKPDQQPAPAGGPPQRAQQTPGPSVQIGAGGNGGVQPRQPTSVSIRPPARGAKLTDQSVASQYLSKAGGDPAKARALAKADGWEF